MKPRLSRGELMMTSSLFVGIIFVVVLYQFVMTSNQQIVSQSTSNIPIVHIVGSVSQNDQTSVFDIWIDAPNERFIVNREELGKYIYMNGAMRIMAPVGSISLDYQNNTKFEEAAIQALDYFAFVLIPGLREQLVDLGEETVNGDILDKARDPLGRIILISENNLPVRIRSEQNEMSIIYSTITTESSIADLDDIFDNPTPNPLADSVSGYHYKATDIEFNNIFQFSDYDVYWLGRQYGDWICNRANRTKTSGPLSSALAQLNQQPQAIDDHFEIRYTLSGQEESAAYLLVSSFPDNAIDVPLSSTATVTEVSVGQRSAELIDFGQSKAIRLTINDVRVDISSNQGINLIDVALQLTRLQDGDS